MEEDRVVYTFHKNSTEEIRLSLREYKERRYLDVRLWYQPLEGGEYRPTKKGITLGLEFIPELKRGLERAAKSSSELAGHSTAAPIK